MPLAASQAGTRRSSTMHGSWWLSAFYLDAWSCQVAGFKPLNESPLMIVITCGAQAAVRGNMVEDLLLRHGDANCRGTMESSVHHKDTGAYHLRSVEGSGAVYVGDSATREGLTATHEEVTCCPCYGGGATTSRACHGAGYVRGGRTRVYPRLSCLPFQRSLHEGLPVLRLLAMGVLPAKATGHVDLDHAGCVSVGRGRPHRSRAIACCRPCMAMHGYALGCP
ncbi:hypothetical protein Dimus_003507 [Dionaea muscipula]